MSYFCASFLNTFTRHVVPSKVVSGPRIRYKLNHRTQFRYLSVTILSIAVLRYVMCGVREYVSDEQYNLFCGAVQDSFQTEVVFSRKKGRKKCTTVISLWNFVKVGKS